MEFNWYKLVSSDGNDETYILNKTGPRMLPCGTPKYIGRYEDVLSSHCTYSRTSNNGHLCTTAIS